MKEEEEEEEARIQKVSSSPTSPSEPARLGRPTYSARRCFPRRLQLGVCIGSLIVAQGPAIVRTEVRREREDACGEIGRQVSSGRKQRSFLGLGVGCGVSGQISKLHLRISDFYKSQNEEGPPS